MRRTILRYPRLDTVLMVEEFIQKHSGDFKKSDLWKRLPKKMMYQTYCVVLDYLMGSGKIAVDSGGNIAWVWNPDLIKNLTMRKRVPTSEMSERLRKLSEIFESLYEIERGARKVE